MSGAPAGGRHEHAPPRAPAAPAPAEVLEAGVAMPRDGLGEGTPMVTSPLRPFPDIPTALTVAESERLEELADDRFVLEAGALLGYSTIVLARVAAHVVSVDPHDGYPADDPRPTLDSYLANLKRYDVVDRVTPVLMTLDLALPFLTPEYFDLVFFDLTGEYEDTAQAMRSVEHWLTGGLAALAVHDCGHPEWPGVQRAVAEFGERTGIEPQLVDRLAVFIPA